MKKKNGFTLVELLAVIVVLAIIMIIAIPAILDVMNNARKSSFVLYVEKVVGATQTQYMYDANGGPLKGAGVYVYNIETDLNLTTTGSYRGYVVVDATVVDKPVYHVFLHDDNYQVIGASVSDANTMPTASDVKAYVQSEFASAAGDELKACGTAHRDVNCYNRLGYQYQ